VVKTQSVKEEADFAALTWQFAEKLGYDHVRVLAWTEKQVALVEESFSKRKMSSPGCAVWPPTSEVGELCVCVYRIMSWKFVWVMRGGLAGTDFYLGKVF
jgi:hypothetical protein